MAQLNMEYESVTSSKNGQLPFGFMAQLVEHRTGIAEVRYRSNCLHVCV